MLRTGQLGVALLLVLSIAACQTTPVTPSAPAAGAASPSPVATGSTPSATAVLPSATPVPPATTAFAAVTDRSRNGRLRLSTVLTSDGAPLAGAQVIMTITALDSTYQTITLTGIVPVPTKGALVGFRFNEEGAGPTRIDMKVYRITYADGGTTKNRIINAAFASGLYSWDVWGSGRTTVQNSDRDDGRMLRLRASPDQNIGINSFGLQRFTPGSDFKLTVKATVPPFGSLTGYAAVFFLWGKDNTEGYRLTVPLVAPPMSPAHVTSSDDGLASVDLAVPAGRYAVQIAYTGDADHLPASVEQQVTVP
jgi:hypothetical protein